MPMKQGFKFASGKIAYSVERLCRLCQEEKEEEEAIYHLENGHIEQWLDFIGERELAEKAYEIRSNFVISSEYKLKTFIDHFDIY